MKKCFSSLILLKSRRNRSVSEKNIYDGEEITKIINATKSCTEFASVEEPLNMQRTATNETILASGTPNIIKRKTLSLLQFRF